MDITSSIGCFLKTPTLNADALQHHKGPHEGPPVAPLASVGGSLECLGDDAETADKLVEELVRDIEGICLLQLLGFNP